MDQRHIQGQQTFLEQQWEFGKQYRCEVRSPFLNCLADVLADEHGVHPDMTRYFRAYILRGSNTQGLAYFDILQGRRSFDQLRKKLLWNRGVPAQENTIP